MTIGPISTIVLTVFIFSLSTLILFLFDRGVFKAKIVEIDGKFFVRRLNHHGFEYLNHENGNLYWPEKFRWWEEGYKRYWTEFETIEEAEESYQKYLSEKKKPKVKTIKTL
jgi:hypothetical protein